MDEFQFEYNQVDVTHGWQVLINTAAEKLLLFFDAERGELTSVYDFFEDGSIVFKVHIESEDSITILELNDERVITMIDYEEKQIRIDDIEVLAESAEEY